MENNPEQPIEQPVNQQAPIQQQSAQQPIGQTPKPKGKLKLVSLLVALLLIVGAGTYLLSANQGKFLSQFFLKPTPTLIPVSPTPTPDPTADWKTYKNDEYGFEFQYPTNFFHQKNNGETQDYGSVMLAEFKAIDEKKLSLLLNETTFSVDYLKRYAPTGSENISPESRAIGKNTFYYYGSGGGGVCYPDQYFINLDKAILIFNFTGCIKDKKLSAKYKEIENQILSTIKLTDKKQTIDISGWKTYANKESRFEIKYPNDWKLDENFLNGVNAITFSAPEQEHERCTDCATFSIRILQNSSQKSLEELTRELQQDIASPSAIFITSISDTIIDNRPAKRLSYGNVGGFGTENIMILSSEKIFKLIYYSSNVFDDEFQKHKKIYAQILSTFKFTD